MTRAGITRAEATTVTTALSTDKVLLQRLNTSNPVVGQYSPYQITVANLFAGGADTPTLNLGTSGVAGTLNIYPSTASSGHLSITDSSSSGNFTTTVTLASQAAARTYTIIDAGANANFVMTQSAQTLAGVKTFSSVPIGTQYVVQIYLTPITALAGLLVVLHSCMFSGTVTFLSASVNAAISTSNIVITPSIYTGTSGTAITSGVVTLTQSGSGVGTTATATPSAANTFVAGQMIAATITGGTATVNGVISLLITRTA